MNRMCSFLKKRKDLLMYLLFGGLTTVVSFALYFSLYHCVQLPAAWSNVISWIGAVLFAFLTNKPFVFHSCDWSAAVTIPELSKFVGSRIFSGLIETLFLALTVDFLQFHNLAMKLTASVIVVILNYVASKVIVFRNKENKS